MNRDGAQTVTAPRTRAALAFGLLCAAAQAQAQVETAPRKLRVVLHVQSQLDRDLLERVRGQLSDVAVELLVADEPAPDQELAARARHVEALAAAHAADVALWFAAPAQGDTQLLVFVSAVGRDPVLVRRLDAGGPASSSGLLEAGALVVRSSLRTLADGEPLGVSLERLERAETPQHAAPAPLERPAIDPAPRRASGVAAAPTRAVLAVLAGWQGVVDGSGAPGQHGLLVRGATAYGLLELALALSASLPVTRRDDLAELRIARHSALVSIGLQTARGDLRLSGGAHGGVALFQRTTSARSSTLAAQGARFTAAALLGPWLGFAFMPGSLGLGVQLALDVLPGPPRFVYEQPSGDRLAHRPWMLQPRAAIGLAGELR